MKYELPEDLKRHYLPCAEAQTLTTYRGRKRRCRKEDYRQCWEQQLRKDLQRDLRLSFSKKVERIITYLFKRHDNGLREVAEVLAE